MKKRECGDYSPDEMHNDYMRHRREGTKPCVRSVRAWAERQRIVRQGGRR